ncbi:MAG: NAD(P)H-dependent oxidoreductase [Deltaproteobacteria bacterium]|nr:NAD(P)H-dependent oxidoreductase [Deltaproteobacteria bacterium]
MKILILNGSPKKKLAHSFSQVYIDHIISLYPQHTFETVFVARDIDDLAQKASAYDEFKAQLTQCDGVLWQMPVYSAQIPGQVKQFIEIIFNDNEVRERFAHKYCTIITTSVLIYDNLAEHYLRSVCEQMGARCTEAFPGVIQPPINDAYRAALKGHMDRFFDTVEKKALPPLRFTANCDFTAQPLALPSVPVKKTNSPKRIGLITDFSGDNENLRQMVNYFAAVSDAKVDVLDLSQTNIKGCGGCLHCGESFKCAVNDNFREHHDRYVLSADAVVYACVIRDDYISYRIKNFIDREFYQNHMPFYQAKPLGLILSGPSQRVPFLQESLDAIWSLRGAKLNAPVYDDSRTGIEVAHNLQWLASTLEQKMMVAQPEPLGFYGAAALRLFRDFSWLVRFPFVAEYKHMKAAGRYGSFPHKLHSTRYRIFKLKLLMTLKGFSKALQKYNDSRMKGMRKLLPS